MKMISVEEEQCVKNLPQLSCVNFFGQTQNHWRKLIHREFSGFKYSSTADGPYNQRKCLIIFTMSPSSMNTYEKLNHDAVSIVSSHNMNFYTSDAAIKQSVSDVLTPQMVTS